MPNKSKTAKGGKKKAWIIGNIISFKQPTYNSPFFDAEEVEVTYILKAKKK